MTGEPLTLTCRKKNWEVSMAWSQKYKTWKTLFLTITATLASALTAWGRGTLAHAHLRLCVHTGWFWSKLLRVSMNRFTEKQLEDTSMMGFSSNYYWHLIRTEPNLWVQEYFSKSAPSPQFGSSLSFSFSSMRLSLVKGSPRAIPASTISSTETWLVLYLPTYTSPITAWIALEDTPSTRTWCIHSITSYNQSCLRIMTWASPQQTESSTSDLIFSLSGRRRLLCAGTEIPSCISDYV